MLKSLTAIRRLHCRLSFPLKIPKRIVLRFETPLQDCFYATRHAKAGVQPNDNFIHIQASQRGVDRDFQSVYSRLVLCKTFRLVYTMTQWLSGW